MSRQIRKKSGTCIYHIILRGINDQKRSVFLCPSGSKRPEVEQPLCKAKNRPRDYTAVPKSTSAPLNVAFKLSANEITSVDSTEYYGAYIYENGAFRQFNFGSGYIVPSGAAYAYKYYLKDHLGSNRVVVSSAGTIEQTTHYYPYGATLSTSTGQNAQPYKYNGKELDRMHRLDLYDYGARQYDPVIGQFTQIDPLCEKYYHISPYAYCNNNPIKYIDPDGLTIVPVAYNKIDNQGNAIGQRYRSYIRFINAMTKFGHSSYGKKFIGAFIPKGFTQYGVKGTGEYANYVLKIKQLNTDKNWLYTGEQPGSVKYGSLVPSEEDGTLVITLLIDLRNNNSESQLLETIIHELCLHGYKIGNLIEAYKKGGLDAVRKLWNQDPGGEKEHHALRKKDIKDPAVKCYYKTTDELFGLDRDLLEIKKFGE